MARSDYPGSADLAAFLASLGVTSSAAQSAQYEQAMNGAVSAWETAVKRRPFLTNATATQVLRRFDPPTFYDGGISTLYLPDLLPQEDIVVAYQPTGSTLTTFTEDSDYRFGPVNAAADGVPYEWLELYSRRWTQPQSPSLRSSLRITGRWGWGTEIPDDVWTALLGRGFYNVFAAVRQGATGGGLLRVKEGDVEIGYGVEGWTQLLLPYVGSVSGSNPGQGGAWGDAVRAYTKMSL